MGCDIHFYVERKVNGQWEQQYVSGKKGEGAHEQYQNKLWYHGRHYRLFALLADVRNRGDITPIRNPRGLPQDLSKGLEEEWEQWSGDGHSATYYDLEELLKLRGENLIFTGYLDLAEFKSYKAIGKVEHWMNADLLQKKHKVVSNTEMERILNLTTFLNDGDEYVTEIIWEVPPIEFSEEFWRETLDKVAALDPNPENLRCVMWFDN